jgi:hypothetical protein
LFFFSIKQDLHIKLKKYFPPAQVSTMLEEEFAEFPIERYQNRYYVSNLGHIYSKRTKQRLNSRIMNGFNTIFIYTDRRAKQYRIDKLVALAFIGKEKQYLLHRDGNKLNDRVDNLKWFRNINYLRIKYRGRWKAIKNLEGYYISNKGKIWSSKSDSIIKEQKIAGYPSVNIGSPKRLFQHIHRFVAIAFCSNLNNHPIVNHKDGNKDNYYYKNLEWVNNSENVLHGRSMKKEIEDTTGIKIKSTSKIETDHTPPLKYKVLDWLPKYLICKDGKIFSLKRQKYLAYCLNNSGYYRVRCNKKNALYVHKLIAEAYLPTPLPDQTQVNHKNRIRTDNRLENLEWCSPSENSKHAQNNPDKVNKSCKSVHQIDPITQEIIKTYISIIGASRETKINSGTIVHCCKERISLAGGYIWKYAEKEQES